MTAEVYGVKCTHCGTQTANVPIWKHAASPEDGDFGVRMVYGSVQLVECAACELEIVVERSSNQAVWPLVPDRAPEGVPLVVGEAYRDALLAHAAGSKIGALLAMRAMGERLLRDKAVKTFSELSGNGVITPAQYGVLDQNRLWANVFGHEDIPTDEIKLEDISELFQFVRTILETIYTQPKVAERFSKMTKKFEKNT